MRSIESIVESIKNEETPSSRAQRREEAFRRRRMQAIERIAESAKKNLEMGNSVEAEHVLEARVKEAMNCRLSLAETFALRAEQGDFSEKLRWWEVREHGHTLWKGYVMENSIKYRDFSDGNNVTKVSSARVAEVDGYVADIYTPSSVAVGFSKDLDFNAVKSGLDGLLTKVKMENISQLFLEFIDEVNELTSGVNA